VVGSAQVCATLTSRVLRDHGDKDASSVRLPLGHSRHRCIERPTAPGAQATSMHRPSTCPGTTPDIDASTLDLPRDHPGHRCTEPRPAPGPPRTSMHRASTCPGATPRLDAPRPEVPGGQSDARCIDVRGARGAVGRSMHRCPRCPGGSRTLECWVRPLARKSSATHWRAALRGRVSGCRRAVSCRGPCPLAPRG
jgi:hypothetical protein